MKGKQQAARNRAACSNPFTGSRPSRTSRSLTCRRLSFDDSDQICAGEGKVRPVQPGPPKLHLVVLLQLEGREWSCVVICHTYPQEVGVGTLGVEHPWVGHPLGRDLAWKILFAKLLRPPNAAAGEHRRSEGRSPTVEGRGIYASSHIGRHQLLGPCGVRRIWSDEGKAIKRETRTQRPARRTDTSAWCSPSTRSS